MNTESQPQVKEGYRFIASIGIDVSREGEIKHKPVIRVETNTLTDKDVLWNKIRNDISKEFHSLNINFTTENGETQAAEKKTIEFIREYFKKSNTSFEEAGSQQSKDFRNVGGIGLNIEVKKTDGSKIMCNDTCPSDDIYYIVFIKGKTYKKKGYEDRPPQCLFLKGNEILEGSDWISEFKRELNDLLDKYGRGKNAHNLTGLMKVFPRGNYSFPINSFLGGVHSSLKINNSF